MSNNSNHSYTALEISKRLGFSTAAFDPNARFEAKDVAILGKTGIKRMEICGLRKAIHFDYYDIQQISELMEECQKQNIFAFY